MTALERNPQSSGGVWFWVLALVWVCLRVFFGFFLALLKLVSAKV